MKRRDNNQWMKIRWRDEFCIKARKEGYRARSAYKLLEINEKFQLIKKNDRVLDLGCAPGAWLQVAMKLCANLDGIDLLNIEPLAGVRFLQGDINSQEATSFLESHEYDVILSDMAPNCSGQKGLDALQSAALGECALKQCFLHLKVGGNFCIKIFEGLGSNEFVQQLVCNFEQTKRFKPKASNADSREFFMVCKFFKKIKQL